jgi:hypothetical protein
MTETQDAPPVYGDFIPRWLLLVQRIIADRNASNTRKKERENIAIYQLEKTRTGIPVVSMKWSFPSLVTS